MSMYVKDGITVRDKSSDKTREELIGESLELIRTTDFTSMIENFKKVKQIQDDLENEDSAEEAVDVLD